MRGGSTRATCNMVLVRTRFCDLWWVVYGWDFGDMHGFLFDMGDSGFLCKIWTLTSTILQVELEAMID